MKGYLDSLASVALTIASLAVVYYVVTDRSRPSVGAPPPQVRPLPSSMRLTGLPVIGNPAATVWVVEFSDFECPYCRSFAKATWPAIKRDYVDTGKIGFSLLSMPLDEIHPSARRAAEVAHCAGQQGKFWETAAHLFDNQRDLVSVVSDSGVRLLAETMRIDPVRLDACLPNDGKIRVAAERKMAEEASVDSTPQFLLGRGAAETVKIVERLSGAVSEAKIRASLDKLLLSTSR